MNRFSGLVLALLLATSLVACGGGGDDSSVPDPSAPASESSDAAEPSESAPPTGAPGGGGAIQVDDFVILDQTNAGGKITDAAVPLRSQADVDRFVAAFGAGSLSDGIQRVFDRHSADRGTVLLGSVVAIGCDVPKDVHVERVDDDLLVTARKQAESKNQCLAAVTSVALVEVAKSDLPR